MIFWPRPFVSLENKRQRHRRRHQHKHLEMCNGHGRGRRLLHSEDGPNENDRQVDQKVFFDQVSVGEPFFEAAPGILKYTYW